MSTLQRRRTLDATLAGESLEVKAISVTEFLVYDRAERARTGVGIVGFIEALPTGFQVLAFSQLSERVQFDTFDGALRFVSEHRAS